MESHSHGYVVEGCASGSGLAYNSRVYVTIGHFSSRWTSRAASDRLGYRLSRKASSESCSGRSASASASASLQHQHGFSSGSRTESRDSGLGGSRVPSSDSVCDESSTAATSTGSPSHLVERYQKMSMPPLAEGRLRCAWA